MVNRTAKLQVIVPVMYTYMIGTSVSFDGVVLINRFLEDSFERALRKFIDENTAPGRYKGYKRAYQAFADHYDINLEYDITYDGLKQMDFRSRKKSSGQSSNCLNYFFNACPLDKDSTDGRDTGTPIIVLSDEAKLTRTA